MTVRPVAFISLTFITMVLGQNNGKFYRLQYVLHIITKDEYGTLDKEETDFVDFHHLLKRIIKQVLHYFKAAIFTIV